MPNRLAEGPYLWDARKPPRERRHTRSRARRRRRQLLRALDVNLGARGYTVDQALTGAQALKLAADRRPDAVILDLGLPDLDGVEVVRGLRGWTDVPILILSARESEADKVAALDAGADDCVTKPFGIAELSPGCAQPSAAPTMRPTNSRPSRRRTIDLTAKRVTDLGGVEVRLTPTEWGIVELLVRNQGRLVTQQHPQGRLGSALRAGDQLPARPPRTHPPKARTRPSTAALLPHRARDGLPLHRRQAPQRGVATQQLR